MANRKHNTERALRDFERALEDLITILEAEDTPAEALQLATARCQEAFDVVREHETALVGVEAEELRRGRERMLRMHALARNAAAAAAEATAQRVQRAQGARQALGNLRTDAAPGDGFDRQA